MCRKARWWMAVGCLTLGLGCGGSPETAREEERTVRAEPIDTPQGGTTAWVRQLGGLGEEYVFHIAPAPDGGVVLLTMIGDAHLVLVPRGAIGLVRLDSTGAIRWSRAIPASTASLTFTSIAVSGMGNVFVALHSDCTVGTDCPDFGGGQATGAMLVKLAPDGRFVWQRDLQGVAIPGSVTLDPNGGAAVVVRRLDAAGARSSRIVKYRWDGVRLWDRDPPAANGAGIASDPTALAFDPSGNMLVGDRLALTSLDPNGAVRWTAHLAEPSVEGSFIGIGTTSLGTVVAVVQHMNGTVSWAGTQSTISGPDIVFHTVLAVAEPNGAPRFARVVDDHGQAFGMSVDPAGRVAITLKGIVPGCTESAEKWNLAGALVWNRTYGACDAGGSVFATGIAIDRVTHHVVVAGALDGRIDLGTGPVTSRGAQDGIVIDLRP